MAFNIVPKKIIPYFIPVTAYLVTLAGFLTALGYEGSFLALNGGMYSWLDWPMFIITHLGDSLILSSLMAMVLIWKKPNAVVNLAIMVILTGVLGQLLKIFIFEGWDRPLRVFNESPIVHTLPHYRLFHNSFPSGHSITAMAAFTSLVWSIRPQWITQVVIAFIAIVVTYSRVFLGVHFPGDVLAGSLIGIIIPLLLLPYVSKWFANITFKNNIKVGIACLAFVLFIAGTWIITL